MCNKEDDWSSDSDEGAREDALDAAGLGDVRDVYQVQPGNSFATLKPSPSQSPSLGPLTSVVFL